MFKLTFFGDVPLEGDAPHPVSSRRPMADREQIFGVILQWQEKARSRKLEARLGRADAGFKGTIALDDGPAIETVDVGDYRARKEPFVALGPNADFSNRSLSLLLALAARPDGLSNPEAAKLRGWSSGAEEERSVSKRLMGSRTRSALVEVVGQRRKGLRLNGDVQRKLIGEPWPADVWGWLRPSAVEAPNSKPAGEDGPSCPHAETQESERLDPAQHGAAIAVEPVAEPLSESAGTAQRELLQHRPGEGLSQTEAGIEPDGARFVGTAQRNKRGRTTWVAGVVLAAASCIAIGWCMVEQKHPADGAVPNGTTPQRFSDSASPHRDWPPSAASATVTVRSGALGQEHPARVEIETHWPPSSVSLYGLMARGQKDPWHDIGLVLRPDRARPSEAVVAMTGRKRPLPAPPLEFAIFALDSPPAEFLPEWMSPGFARVAKDGTVEIEFWAPAPPPLQVGYIVSTGESGTTAGQRVDFVALTSTNPKNDRKSTAIRLRCEWPGTSDTTAVYVPLYGNWADFAPTAEATKIAQPDQIRTCQSFHDQLPTAAAIYAWYQQRHFCRFDMPPYLPCCAVSGKVYSKESLKGSPIIGKTYHAWCQRLVLPDGYVQPRCTSTPEKCNENKGGGTCDECDVLLEPGGGGPSWTVMPGGIVVGPTVQSWQWPTEQPMHWSRVIR